MTYVCLFIRKDNERLAVKNEIKSCVAFLCDDRLDIGEYKVPEAVKDSFDEKVPQMAVIEISGEGDILVGEDIRSGNEDTDIMLVADAAISPMKYLKPQIRAAALLLRPYKLHELKEVICSFVRDHYRKRSSGDRSGSLLVENRQGSRRVPFGLIYYIEIREKRLYVRLKNTEYSMYGTLDAIIEKLPESFVKTHRSYVINAQYLVRIKLSENTVELEDGIAIPLSRSYKKSVKECFYGMQGG